ncbi:hypothetical protein L9F63_001771 [Diploptera punctata]|uniref:tRNA-specific adenosine deaminase 1 n=1 Tax=Diploptera punctata TaxID=6984 RepID=A0AAD8A3B5_DIPPU|nr:hypothetical protein L9F63_001771 [Diploptera punctata]
MASADCIEKATGSNWNSEFADKMADVCYKKYESLPKKGKPATGKEWTLMACVVKIEGFKKNNSCNTSMEVVSLDASDINEEYKDLELNSKALDITEKPILIAYKAKRLIENDVHRTGAKCLPSESVQDEHLPGINYHVVGVLRTKPGRGCDPTLSLSCSDKLARWNVVGCQGALLSLLIDKPIYFQSVIIGGGCPFSETVLQRAIIDPSPVIAQSTISFVHSRDSDDKKPCPSSLVWCNVPESMLQVAVEGKKQGATKKLAHTPAGRLLVCKRELLSQFIKVTLSMPQPMLNIPIILKSKQVIWDMNEDDIKRYLDHISYKQLKYLSQDYKKAWEMVRSVCFPSWLKKCDSYLNFVCSE